MADLEQYIASVRKFNRFYTRELGLLSDNVLGSSFSLTEARVLFELAQSRSLTANALAKDLGLDAGYLSRVIRRLEADGLLRRAKSRQDGRQLLLEVTAKGQREFARLDTLSQQHVGGKLEALTDGDKRRLVEALTLAHSLLSGSPPSSTLVLRQHKPGDMGWVVEQHGATYAREYGWNESFEALVAEIVAKFVQHFDGKRERCWIAELNGERVGSIFLVRKTDRVAKLRLLLVDQAARGRGLGRRLVDECLQFARQAGYRKVTLWTNSILVAARGVYEQAGFKLVAEEPWPHETFAKGLISQTWEKVLQGY